MAMKGWARSDRNIVMQDKIRHKVGQVLLRIGYMYPNYWWENLAQWQENEELGRTIDSVVVKVQDMVKPRRVRSGRKRGDHNAMEGEQCRGPKSGIHYGDVKEEQPCKHLCQAYGISENTGYKRNERFIQEGTKDLTDKSRAPNHSPTGLPEDTLLEIIRLKNQYPAWGTK